MSEEQQPRRAFPAQSMPWTARQLNRWYREDEHMGAEEWPLPVSGDATAWAADGNAAAWEAMTT